MASVTLVSNNATTTGTGPYTLNAFTPAPGSLLVVLLAISDHSTADAATLTDSIAELTFSRITVGQALFGSSTHRMYTFVSDQPANGLNRTLSAGVGGDDGSGIGYAVYQVEGVSRYGAGAIKQIKVAANQSAGTPAVTFDASPSTSNAIIGAVANLTNPAGISPPTGFAEGTDDGYGTPTIGWETVSRNSGHSSATVTWGSSSASAFGAIIVEVDCTSSDPMPGDDLSGWSRINYDDFTDGDVASFGTASSQAAGGTCSGLASTPYFDRWWHYQSTIADTRESATGDGGHYQSADCSIKDGHLRLAISRAAGETRAQAPILKTVPGTEVIWQTYGRYAIRWWAEDIGVEAFKVAWLLWPDNGNWPDEGEVDFPEGGLHSGGDIQWFLHWEDGGHQQTTVNSGVPLCGDWHTTVIEWSPDELKFFLDGVQVGSTRTTNVPSTDMYWVLQTESQIGGSIPTDVDPLTVLVDWIAIWEPEEEVGGGEEEVPPVTQGIVNPGSGGTDLSILLKSVDGAWTRLGADGSRGIVPEGFSCSANEPGPDTASFTLRRVAHLPWPDLLAFNRCEVWVGAALVWGGRIWEAPLSDTDEDVIGVQGRGWQYHLDDDLLLRMYAHTRMTDYVDQRSKPNASLASFRAGPQVSASDGVVTLTFPDNTDLLVGDAIGVTFDAGGNFINRAVVSWERGLGGLDGNMVIISRASDFENAALGGDDAQEDLDPAQSGTLAHTTTAPRRYHHIIFFRQASAVTLSADSGVRITAVKLFSSTAYESGNASILKASQVVEDVLASSAVPLLDSSEEAIETSSFSIPEFVPQGRQTPRALIDAVNAYENNLAGVDARRRLFFRERPAVATLEVGAWSGSSFQDGSTNSGEGLYNRVIVQGTGPDGAPLEVIRTSAEVAPETDFALVNAGVSNPGFEVNTSGWTATTGTLTRVTGSDANGNVFIAGSASARHDTSADGIGKISTTLSNLTVGALHSVRFQWRRAAITNFLTLTSTVTSGGAVLGSQVDDTYPAAGVWSEPQVSFIADATTATLTIDTVVFRISGGAVSAFYLDDIRVYRVVSTLIDRQGFVRTATLPVASALTATAAGQIGDLWLAERISPPFKGSCVVNPGGCRHALTGNPIHPSELLLQVGERMRFCHLPDPATGASAREGTIKSVSYAHDTQTATVELDNERGRLEALLQRLAVVTGQLPG